MFNFTGKNKIPPMLNVLIIDDEPHIRITLKSLIKVACRQVNVVGEADSVESGIKAINTLKPDLVLLDIRMDDGTGFDLLEHFQHVDFKVIFITAYEQHALDAFRFSAVDYILKPVNPEKLVEAIERTRQMVIGSFQSQINILKENLKPENRANRKIVLKTQENIHFLSVSEIICCESDSNYTTFNTVSGERILISRVLKDFDEMLTDYGFFRVHRSHLINLRHIKRFEKLDGGYVIMTGDIRVPVSSRSKDKLLQLFEQIFEL